MKQKTIVTLSDPDSNREKAYETYINHNKSPQSCHFDVRRNHTRNSTKISDSLCEIPRVISPNVEMTKKQNCIT